MIEAIEYIKTLGPYSEELIYLYDSTKMTEEEAKLHLEADSYTPYGCSISKEHFHNIIKKLIFPK